MVIDILLLDLDDLDFNFPKIKLGQKFNQYKIYDQIGQPSPNPCEHPSPTQSIWGSNFNC
jgi:hypothetical protein